mmetsp:Transcript_83012/g.267514  ORF Transcript_83012/g.267514 Transcript_83012/m.267514 type:complete len:462 (-) Transcript_83012:184-1569(-)
MLEKWFYSIDAALNRSSEIKELFPSSATTMRGLASGTSAGALLDAVAKMESSPGVSSCQAPCTAGDVPWSLVNAVILLSTADLPPTATFGDPVNSWAKSKWWLPSVSVATPAVHNDRDVQVTVLSENGTVVSYQVKSEMPDIPLYTPAKFSICLGDGAHKQAPLPFCATADCFGNRLLYPVSGGALLSRPLWEGYASAFSNVSQVGLLGVASASSAFLGPVVLQRPETCETSSTRLLQSAWFTSGNDSFLEGTNNILASTTLPPTQVATIFAHTSTQAIMDGAFTDSTGILQAVAAGAADVTSYISDLRSLWNLFAGGNSTLNGPDPCFSNVLFFQIFSTPWHTIEAEVKSFKCLKVPSIEGRSDPAGAYLTSICFGTVTTTTAENTFAGVEGGREVKLHIVIVESTLDSLPFPVPDFTSGQAGLDWRPYGRLVTEISTTMGSRVNRAAVKELAKTFFLRA